MIRLGSGKALVRQTAVFERTCPIVVELSARSMKIYLNGTRKSITKLQSDRFLIRETSVLLEDQRPVIVELHPLKMVFYLKRMHARASLSYAAALKAASYREKELPYDVALDLARKLGSRS